MTEHTAQLVVDLATGYAVAGLLFATVFVTRLVGRIDPSAADGTWGFRLVIIPGVVAFWPHLLGRLLRGATMPPDEWTAHRAASHRAAAPSPVEPTGETLTPEPRTAPPNNRDDVGKGS